ncbi:MAG: DUF4430 domain-containing protein [bacterium]
MTQSLRLLGILFIIALLVIGGCSKKQEAEPKVEAAVETMEEITPVDSIVLEFVSEDSISVYDLLDQKHELELKTTATGAFIIGIDSTYNHEGFFWVYSVNDSMAQISCDQYITKPGDTVRWHYRNMNQ